MKTKQVKLPTEKASNLGLPNSPQNILCLQMNDNIGRYDFRTLFHFYMGRLPNVLEFKNDFKAKELYSFLTKDHTDKILFELNHDYLTSPDYQLHISDCVDSKAILYNTGEMIITNHHNVSYFYIKEELFTKEKLREIGLDFLRPKTVQEFNKLYIMKKDKDWGNRFYPYSSSNEDNFSFDHYNTDFEDFVEIELNKIKRMVCIIFMTLL